jgi:hypothetical protein
MTRPDEPEILQQWREWVKAGPPRMCHTCDCYTYDGKCSEFNMTPPADFAGTADACDRWTPEIPF